MRKCVNPDGAGIRSEDFGIHIYVFFRIVSNLWLINCSIWISAPRSEQRAHSDGPRALPEGGDWLALRFYATRCKPTPNPRIETLISAAVGGQTQ